MNETTRSSSQDSRQKHNYTIHVQKYDYKYSQQMIPFHAVVNVMASTPGMRFNQHVTDMLTLAIVGRSVVNRLRKQFS